MPKRLVNLDIDLLRAFVVIASEKNFTRAAERLMRQQSTISLQLKRLEDSLGQRLIDRTPRTVEVTAAGEAVLTHAQRILDLNDEVVASIQEPQMRGLVRLGVPEHFATYHLPEILARYVQAYPTVELEVTCDLTLNLLRDFRQKKFDIVLFKRERGLASDGVRVWREPLVWVTGPHDHIGSRAPLPLVVAPEPCVYRKRATTALTNARRNWRIAYTCGSLSGSIAAVRAGLGIAVLPKHMVPAGLHLVDGGPLPGLRDTEIALLSADRLPLPAVKMRDHILRCFA